MEDFCVDEEDTSSIKILKACKVWTGFKWLRKGSVEEFLTV
jgi:hypothetical protein